jgi:ubiquinone/menaquinone biosynthesis C-methylase UbiE
MPKHVCPWWLAYTFDNPLRHLFHNPEQIFSPYLKTGMTAVDIGCGMGYFSIGMAHLVGDSGKVIAVDLQQKMLNILMKRTAKAGMANRIKPVLCYDGDINVAAKVDFALAFWMVHETPDQKEFLKQIYTIMKHDGKLLIAEPKMHVTQKEFNSTISIVQETGFNKIADPKIHFSRSTLFEKK